MKDFQNLLPTRRGRRLALFNPKALIPLSKVIVLMRDRQLTEAMRGAELVKEQRNTRWLIALELLERNGYTVGLEPKQLAAELGITERSARDLMNRAEHHIYVVLGITVSFSKHGEPWRLLNHIEVAQKYQRLFKDLNSRVRRAKMYVNITGHHGTEDGSLELPLFRFDFTKEVLNGEAQA